MSWRAASQALPLLAVLLLAAVPVSAPPSTYAKVYLVTVEVETRSDWTSVSFRNGFIGDYNYSLSLPREKLESLVVSSTRLYIGKETNDVTPVTLRVNALLYVLGDKLEIVVSKGALKSTAVRIYRGPGLVAEFNNSGVVPGDESTNTRVYVVQAAQLGEPDYVATPAKPQAPKLVLAFYYPWYGNEAYGGSNSHWGSYSWLDIEESEHYPLLGPYDSRDPRVIMSHIRMAKSYGIDGFIVSWWGIDRYEDRVLPEILGVAEKEGFKVTVYYESNRQLSLNDVVEELTYIVRSYSGHPAYLKVDGKPVIFVYAMSARGRDFNFWRDAVRRVEADTGVDVFFVADTGDVGYLSAFEGIHYYSLLGIYDNPGARFEETALRVRLYATRKEMESGIRHPRFWVATVIPGFNNTKVGGELVYPREGGAAYRRFWDAAISSGADMVAIVTWNEWHEGTEVEPSREYEFQYLHLTREGAERYKGHVPPFTGAKPFLDAKGIWADGYVPVAWLIYPKGRVELKDRLLTLDYNSTHSVTVLPGISREQTYTFEALDGTRILLIYWTLDGKRHTLTLTYHVPGGEEKPRQPTRGTGGGNAGAPKQGVSSPSGEAEKGEKTAKTGKAGNTGETGPRSQEFVLSSNLYVYVAAAVTVAVAAVAVHAIIASRGAGEWD